MSKFANTVEFTKGFGSQLTRLPNIWNGDWSDLRRKHGAILIPNADTDDDRDTKLLRVRHSSENMSPNSVNPHQFRRVPNGVHAIARSHQRFAITLVSGSAVPTSRYLAFPISPTSAQ